MKRIVIDPPHECNLSVSEQLHLEGVRVDDCNFKEGCITIFQIFAKEAAQYYSIVGQSQCNNDREKKCGLCGNTELMTYYDVCNTMHEPLVTHHYGDRYSFPFDLQWPKALRLGSHCVKMVGIPMFVPRMVDSMFSKRVPFQLTPGGLVRVGTVIKNYENWEYEIMVIPHALFTRFPFEVVQAFNLQVYIVNNEIDVSECTQKSIQRSRVSVGKNAKYGYNEDMSWLIGDESWKKYSSDEPIPRLVTVVPRYKAKQIYERYMHK